MDGLVFDLYPWHMSITLPTDSCSTQWMGIDGKHVTFLLQNTTFLTTFCTAGITF